MPNNGQRRRLLKISANALLPRRAAEQTAFLYTGGQAPHGFNAYVTLPQFKDALDHQIINAARIILPAEAGFLGSGDVLRIDTENRSYRVVFRSASNHNSILLTERCNHYCLMCSQPPREINDDWLLEETENLLNLIPPQTKSLGFTGGEPTVYGDRLIHLLRLTKNLLPHTAVHILSNGRRFSDSRFTEAYAAIMHPDLMVGIPLYSDDPVRHNYIVQAENAFEETIKGILRLKRHGQRVELRVVIHQQSIGRLIQLAEFIARNLLFVDQVALMGLEITGFTKGNLQKLWIDPNDYKKQLAAAVRLLAVYRIPVRVYNHQLCVVDDEVRPYCTKSISDWKNEYLPQCGSCDLRPQCGGFFSSAIKFRYSDHISPLRLR